jgi:probable HAF family extracellular repeat protein
MGTWTRVVRLVAVVGLSAAGIGCGLVPDPGYRLVRLPTPGGEAARSGVRVLNDHGQVLGVAGEAVIPWTDGEPTMLAESSFGSLFLNERGDVVTDRPPTIWRDGTPTTITTPTPVVPSALDDHGRVLLSPPPGTSGLPYYLWDDGDLQELEGLPDVPGGEVTIAGMNDRGQIVGEVRPSPFTFPEYAFIWEDGRLTKLGSLGGGNTVAREINQRGQVGGESDLPNGQRHAYLWEDGQMTDIGSLPGTDFSTFEGLSDAGHVVGTSVTATGESHAYRWHRGTMIDLGTLGGDFSIPADVNNRGEVVGSSTMTRTGTDPSHGFIWRRGRMQALPGLGGFHAFPLDINNHGQIAGDAWTPDDVAHAVLWIRTHRPL